MVLFLLMISLALGEEKCVDRNDVRNMCSGHTFIAKEASRNCVQTISSCASEAQKFCHSHRVKRAECIQQYGGVWMTKCYCE